MVHMLNDGIATMIDLRLSAAGDSCLYIRGNSTTTITMGRQEQGPMLDELASGMTQEIHLVDFVCKPSDLPYTEPQRGDRIVCGGKTHEVNSIGGEKVYRQINPSMIRIHTKRVK